MRDGIRANGANHYPATPYTAYRGLPGSNIQALHTYFTHGVSAVDEPVARTQLAFAFNQRWLIKGWNLLFLKGEPPPITPLAEDKVARGRYLVDTLGHCGLCYTPCNLVAVLALLMLALSRRTRAR
ncbi:hypothetical protein [Pseudomonas typographi]|uniref:Uncharacterized protein n=1 Tax=Pseudomonas typographi TaxID=2715964 RepID=A0ABR7Z719_9PSED|nr:hypothetical protein [Pseudomonas typographi]MBD1551125.1 hypothetical protein [Pseudomonas typographi]MBD1601340.1 hypothetical protein [Pseudomonas typographi]